MERITYKFERLEVWRLSLELSDLIYLILRELPKNEDFNLKSQLLRATTSISLNIAEGSTASTNPEQARFLKISIRSLIEVVACLRLIDRRRYLQESILLDQADRLANKLFAKLQSFISSFK